MESRDSTNEPIMPTFSIGWLFAAMAIVALTLIYTLTSNSDRRILLVMIVVLGMCASFALLSSLAFVVSYVFGAIQQLFRVEKPTSPFAGENLPPQVIPPSENNL